MSAIQFLVFTVLASPFVINSNNHDISQSPFVINLNNHETSQSPFVTYSNNNGISELATVINLDDQKTSKYMGIGAISGGGATSKYLTHYSNFDEIMDLLFRPNHGASLQILKVEIGGDCESSSGSEASHMHTEHDENYFRGYEWKIMTKAKKLNSKLHLSGLSWCFPSWLRDPYLHPDKLAKYTTNWITGAKEHHNLTIDSIGIWNEKLYNKDYMQILRNNLDQYSPDTKIIAADGVSTINQDMETDTELAGLVDIVGLHYPDDNYNYNSQGKPQIASEDQFYGGGFVARFNRNYIKHSLTGFLAWCLASSYNPGLPYYGTGIILASEPWSNHFTIRTPFFEIAHVTHHVDMDWVFLKKSSGFADFGSYVTLASPSRDEFLILVETAGANSEINHKFIVSRNNMVLHVRRTKLTNDGDKFTRMANVEIVDGEFSFTFEPDYVYSFSTRDTNDITLPSIPPSANFPYSFTEDFENLEVNSEAPYLSQQCGSFEVMEENGNRFYRQMAPALPVFWTPVPCNTPFTLFPTATTNSVINIKVKILPQLNVMPFVMLRMINGGLDSFNARGLFFFYNTQSNEAFFYNDLARLSLIERIPNAATLPLPEWIRMTLSARNNEITAKIEGRQIFAKSFYLPRGIFAGFGLSGYEVADFDDIEYYS